MRRVILGTPCYDGTLTAIYVDSLVRTMAEAATHNTVVYPIFVCYDTLIQRARNDLARMAIEADVDNLVFIDADQGWEPKDFFRLLEHDVDIVGGIVPKKDDTPAFNVRILAEERRIEDGRIEVEYVGTGMMCISSMALTQIWEVSPEYTNEGKVNRMLFDIAIVEGNLVSEDNIFCHKWRDLGGQVWLDPYAQCTHIGAKLYDHNFIKFLEDNNVRA
jgi:hypothetical protein